MPKEKDHLSNLVSVNAALTESGVSAETKSRAVAAFDRLLGSALDIPAAKLESVAARIRANSDQEIKLVTAKGDAEILNHWQEMGGGFAQDMLARQIEKTANKRKITERAIEYLKDDAAPPEEPEETTELEDDWLNCFEDYAEKASSERLQTLWARVLAGEIRKPKSFSIATLRFLAELDQDMATIFERETKHRIKSGYILKPEKLEGQRLLDLTFLEEVGLLQEISIGMELSLEPNAAGVVIIREGRYVLLLKSHSKIKYSVIRITRIGREITRILPEKNPIEVLERIGNRLLSQCKCATIERVVGQSGGKIFHEVVKILKEEAK